MIPKCLQNGGQNESKMHRKTRSKKDEKKEAKRDHDHHRPSCDMRHLEPKMSKRRPRVPRDVFWALFWHLLEHLGVPFAPRGHTEATLSHNRDPTCVLMHFWYILVPPGGELAA